MWSHWRASASALLQRERYRRELPREPGQERTAFSDRGADRHREELDAVFESGEGGLWIEELRGREIGSDLLVKTKIENDG